jgi:hypothetical protein
MIRQKDGKDRKAVDAEAVAVAALTFIAGDEQLLGRFLQITGIHPSKIRESAAEPGFLAGVLTFVLAHEPTLLQFAQQADIAPESAARALHALSAGTERHDAST